MEERELGQFIAGLRKEKQMTEAELASRLHVTDKAVSGGRGIGNDKNSQIRALTIFTAVLLFTYTRYGYVATERNDRYGTVYSYRNELCCLPGPRGEGGLQSSGRYILLRESAHELDGG